MENKTKVESIVGDFTWEEVRNILVYRLQICETEEDFIRIFQGIINSVGTYKDLKKLREDLKIYPFTEEEKNKMLSKKGFGRPYGY